MVDKKLPQKSFSAEVDGFLAKVAATPPVKASSRRGRLLFAMDATASREPTWDSACSLQAELFTVTDSLGGLWVQLCHYRGIGEFHASPWLDNSTALLEHMTTVRCSPGRTQIARVLHHAVTQTRQQKVDALVVVGDCVEEDVDELCVVAGELGVRGTPVFVFHEGHEPHARHAFERIARLTGGACCAFDSNSADQLRDLLAAVAVYAAGGRRALEDLGKRRGDTIKRLVRQIGGG